MDDFREWLSDNLRYIMLGLGIVLVLAILFFGIRFLTNKLSDEMCIRDRNLSWLSFRNAVRKN